VTTKNRVNSSNRDTQEHVVERRSRRPVLSVLAAGLILGILIAPFLVVESGLAAGVVADEPCLTCPSEASAAAYAARLTGLANDYLSREADFYFQDHELAFFHRVNRTERTESEADFYFQDHELAFFGLDTEAPCGPWTPGMAC
jgi:hypothetical protein